MSEITNLTLSSDQLPNPLAIPRPAHPFQSTIRPPGSKSLTNRALLLAALAEGRSTLRGALTDADDAKRMILALRALGVEIDVRPESPTTLRIRGVGGRWLPDMPQPRGVVPETIRLDLGNAGTATRFLAAAAILGPPPTTAAGILIDGNERMRQRPIGDLANALRAIGVGVEFPKAYGFPPMLVRPVKDLSTLRTGVDFGRTASSQFISALMLIAPWLPRGLTVRLPAAAGEITSPSYIEMTIGLLRRCGAVVNGRMPGPIRIEPAPIAPGAKPDAPHTLRGFEYDVEPDASGATYFWAAAAMVPGSSITIEGLWSGGELSGAGAVDAPLQGDAQFVHVLSRMGAHVGVTNEGTIVRAPASGVLHGISTDLSLMPDAAMTLAVLACFADSPTHITGLRTLRVKETDRLEALRSELTKLGAGVEIVGGGGDEGLRITPIAAERVAQGDAGPIELDTYDDHRMAMSLALAGLRMPNIHVRDPGCVAKTYPTFWQDLARLYA